MKHSRPDATRQRLYFRKRLVEFAGVLDSAARCLTAVGGKKFLFPGDAQIENWNYALTDAPNANTNRSRLEGTDFYKVGRHGSLNATPKSHWNLFTKGSKQPKPGRLNTAVSTMAGKHGSTTRQTEVPRRILVAGPGEESDFFSTQTLKTKGEISREMKFDL
jgi:hypothetical protein